MGSFFTVKVATICGLYGVAVVCAQERPPAPVWPGDENTATIPDAQYVFVTRSGNEVVVLLPKQTEEPGRRIVHIPLHNGVVPQIDAELAIDRQQQFTYDYSVANLNSAQDQIGYFSIVAPSDNGTTLQSPPAQSTTAGWNAYTAHALIVKQLESLEQPRGRYLYWLAKGADSEIRKGQDLKHFRITSPSSPGFTTAFCSASHLPAFPQDWPQQVYSQLDFLNQPQWLRRAVLTIGPTFPPRTERALIVDNFRAGIKVAISKGIIQTKSPWCREVLNLINAFSDSADVSTYLASIAQLATTDWQRMISAAVSITITHADVSFKEQPVHRENR